MPLWGTTTAAGDKPKFLPVDKNAVGSTGSREHAIAVAGGWGLSPGIAASGNDNKDAMPEVLVCVKNLATFMGSASVIGVDWTDATVTDTGTFDITVTFDEAVDITSAAWTADQVVTNKAYILLSRIGKTDMVEDTTMACQYYSGDGSNQIVFRGTAQTGDAAYLGFNSAGVGDTDVITGIIFNGSAALDDEDGYSAIGIRKEAGTAAAGTAGDKIIADGSAAASMTVNGALDQSTTLVIDGVSGATLAVGQVVTVNGAGSAPASSITDADGNTGISTDNSLTITAVASQTSVTVSEKITVADNIVLLASTNGGGEMLVDALSFVVAGPTYASRSDISLITRTGMDTSVAIQLETGTPNSDTGNGRLVINASDGSASNVDSPIVVEAYLNDVSTYQASGSSSGTAYVLKGVDVSA
tara:strand:- start:1058 stop:2302 length:1245 start_codon:yes stop_codon:yes gene_type:complete